MASKVHGKNGLVYVSGSALAYGNAWEIGVEQASAEGLAFGDTWVSRETGAADWSGSLTAWHDQDSKILYSAATAGDSVALLIYPQRTDLSTYWSGNAIFSFRSSADVGGLVGETADFVGDSTLTATGFS